ncbi:hypothetical protein Tco_1475204 [Tanacetum coccineum]
MTYKIKTIQKEVVEIESFKSSAQHSINDFVVINIPEEDVEPKQIILDHEDQPMWESAKTVASTSNSAIVQIDVDENFVINSIHLKMILENKFDGYLQADSHDHIHEFSQSATCSDTVKRRVKLNFSQLVCESLIDAWLRLKSMLQKCHGHGLTKGAIIQIFYHGLDKPTKGIMDITAGGIFLFKSPNQSFQFLKDKVLFKLDWSIKSQNNHHQKSVAFADGSNSNDDNSRLIEKLEALTIKMDSQIISLNEELQDMREKYNELRNGNGSKNNLNNDTLMCERHEANYIQSEGNKNQNSQDSYSYQSHYDRNDSEKSLTKLKNDLRNDLEDFKRCIHSMRTVH